MKSTATYLAWLFKDSPLVELCHMDGRRLDIQWYDSPDDLLHDAKIMATSGNLFTTLNQIDRSSIKEYVTAHRAKRHRKLCRTPDDCVSSYSRLFFDFDPVRPGDCSSTKDELAEAEIRARGLAKQLTQIGWPSPALAMSGNGYHLQYRVALPNTPQIKEQLGVIYSGLYQGFSDDVVTFDRSVRNPARLCALYGFVKRKGLETAERPHRESWIEIPAEWGMVLPEQVAVVAKALASDTPVRSDPRPVEPSMIGGYGNYSTLNVVGWFRAQGLYIGHLEGNKHAVTCPWADEHGHPSPENGSDTIVFESDGGWPGFHCKHSHCAERTIRDVMSLWGDADAFCKEVYTSKAA